MPTDPSVLKRVLTPALPLLAAGAIAALIAAGCAKGGDRSSATASATSAGSATTASKVSGSAQGDAAHGKAVYAAQCAVCHGPTGTEGVAGPSLKSEKRRKTYAQTFAWIKEPLSPMPKLYPDKIGAKDVADVAAYVQTL